MGRPSKRARLEDAALHPPSAAPDQHVAFTSWSLARGVEITHIAPHALPGRGIGLVTTAPVKTGTRLLFVPEKAMFKPDISALKAHSKALDVAGLSPQLSLVLSLMLRSRLADSDLGVWTATWPSRQDVAAGMPLCWDSTLQAHLPDQTRPPFERQLADYARDWNDARGLAVGQGWDEAEFRYFWCIVNSRSFHWRPPKGGKGSMVLCPFVDYMNHAPSGGGCEVSQGADGYSVVAQRDYDAGEEVFATYGAHSNDKLLVHYGFVCESTKQHASADDEIRIDSIILPALSDATKAQLQDLGFLGGYALLPTPADCTGKACDCIQQWEPCFKTQVAVRAALLTANEWEYFATNGEDMTVDQAVPVARWLQERFRAYEGRAHKIDQALYAYSKASDTRDAGPDEDARISIKLLQTRWNQIENAIFQYCQQDYD